MINNPVRSECYVLINPNAGNGKGRKDWERISDLFAREGIRTHSRFTERKGQAMELSREALAEGYRKIISVGGDGTLNEIVNGIFTQNICPTTEVVVGMIPVGTGNDWGRMFGIPLVYEGAVKIIRDNKTMPHDVGTLTYFSSEGQQKRYFMNIAGLGFEAVVVQKTNKQKEKGRSSQAIYLFNLISSLISYKRPVINITIDGKTTVTKAFSVNVGNGRYCGGGMRQTPDAIPDDGLLDITVIKDMGRFEVIKALKILYDGTILSHPKIDGYRSTNLKVTCETALYAEADGESLGHTPVEFGIIPGGINVVYGRKITQ